MNIVAMISSRKK